MDKEHKLPGTMLNLSVTVENTRHLKQGKDLLATCLCYQEWPRGPGRSMFSRISLSPEGLELSDSFGSFCYCKVTFLSLVPSYHMGLRAKLSCLIPSTS